VLSLPGANGQKTFDINKTIERFIHRYQPTSCKLRHKLLQSVFLNSDTNVEIVNFDTEDTSGYVSQYTTQAEVILPQQDQYNSY